MALVDRRHLGARIRAVRLALGLHQSDLADEVGCNAPQIGKYERGLSEIPPDRLERIARLLGVTVAFLWSPDITSDVRRAMERRGYVTTSPTPIDRENPAVKGFVAIVDVHDLPQRVAVLCTPLAGDGQLELLRVLTDQRIRIHHAYIVSEAEPTLPDEGTSRDGLPEIQWRRPAELETCPMSLRFLAEAVLRVDAELPAGALQPRLTYVGEAEPALPWDEFLMAWLNDPAAPLRLNVYGEAGTGKSVMLKRAASLQARRHLDDPERAPCPLYVPLWRWWEVHDFLGALLELIQEHVPLATRVGLKAMLEGGRLVLMFDGYDELLGHEPSRSPAVERGLDVLLQFPCKIVLTARSPALFGRGLRLARLERLCDEDVGRHLRLQLADGGTSLRRHLRQHDLAELARLPYILDMLVEAERAQDQPSVRGGGLAEVLEAHHGRGLKQEAGYFGLCTEELRESLEWLASEIRRAGRPAIHTSDLPEWLAKRLLAYVDPGRIARGQPAPSNRFLAFDEEKVRFVHGHVERYFFVRWVAARLRLGHADALRRIWFRWEDLGLLREMVRLEEAAVRHLGQWALDASTDPDLADLATYLLSFLGRGVYVLDTLRSVARSAGRPSLAESAAFGLAAQGDSHVLDEIVATALGTDPWSNRIGACVQLLSLGQHEDLLPPTVVKKVQDALRQLPIDELQAELEGLVRNERLAHTKRSAAAMGLGYLGDPRARAVLRSVIDEIAAQGPFDRSRGELRLGMAARTALELLELGPFLSRHPKS